MKYLLEEAEKAGKYNIAFETAYLLADPERCVQILMKSKRYAEAGMFAKSYIPSSIPTIMQEWGNILKQNDLQFIPENIYEQPEFGPQMKQAMKIYDDQIKPNLYQQPRAPADEIELQRDRWYQDFGGEGWAETLQNYMDDYIL